MALGDLDCHWHLVPESWKQPYYYDYGSTVYYQNDTVYYQDKPVASAEEYAGQAETIASDVPEELLKQLNGCHWSLRHQ
ncbi:MAG: hypothetical protein R3C11_01045 [Planctomycetaceae bacterium]